MSASGGRRGLWLGAGAVVAAAAVGAGAVAWSLGGSPGRPQVPVRARVYSSFQACLLAGPAGISSAPDSQAWAGLEDASAKTRAKVSYLAVTGPATAANASPFLGSLVVRQCGVVVAAGGAEGAAALADAARFPGVRFVVADPGSDGPVRENVTVVPAAAAGLRGAVAGAVEAAAGTGA